MPRTLIVTNDFPPRTGGIESFVLAVAARLPADQVVVHTARQAGDADFDRDLPYPVVRDPSRLMVPTPAITARVQQTARRFGCDRVWFGAAAPLGLMATALREAGVRRSVGTTHGHEIWWASLPGSRAALHRIGERVDVLTYLGDYCRTRIAAALSPAARARMVQFTPGVDIDRFNPALRAEATRVRQRHHLGEDPVIVCVSRLVARKGQDTLVRAMPAVLQRHPKAKLLLVGDGPHRSAVQRLTHRLGVQRAVVFAGRQPWHDTPAYYAAGTVFAMPTRTRLAGLEAEALGICYLEAAATGLPVIAGDSGGAPDAVQAGVNGYLVNGRDQFALAARLDELLSDPDLCQRFGTAGRQWVTERWGWQRQVDTLQALLTP